MSIDEQSVSEMQAEIPKMVGHKRDSLISHAMHSLDSKGPHSEYKPTDNPHGMRSTIGKIENSPKGQNNISEEEEVREIIEAKKSKLVRAQSGTDHLEPQSPGGTPFKPWLNDLQEPNQGPQFPKFYSSKQVEMNVRDRGSGFSPN